VHCVYRCTEGVCVGVATSPQAYPRGIHTPPTPPGRCTISKVVITWHSSPTAPCSRKFVAASDQPFIRPDASAPPFESGMQRSEFPRPASSKTKSGFPISRISGRPTSPCPSTTPGNPTLHFTPTAVDAGLHPPTLPTEVFRESTFAVFETIGPSRFSHPKNKRAEDHVKKPQASALAGPGCRRCCFSLRCWPPRSVPPPHPSGGFAPCHNLRGPAPAGPVLGHGASPRRLLPPRQTTFFVRRGWGARGSSGARGRGAAPHAAQALPGHRRSPRASPIGFAWSLAPPSPTIWSRQTGL